MPASGLRLALFCLLAICSRPIGAFAQSQPTRPEFTGGTFEVNGTTVAVSAAEIARHYDLCARLNPGATPAMTLDAAWARAIRLDGAKALGLSVGDAEFKAHLEGQYAELQATLDAERRYSRERFADDFVSYARTLGFLGAEECFAAWKEELLGRKFVDRLFPPSEATEKEISDRFAAIHTTLVLDVFVYAPEFLPESEAPSREKPEDLAKYREWYKTVPDSRRRFYDDDRHPSMESEAITARFNDKSPAEMKEWFETPRGIENLSVADRTRDFEPSVAERQTMFARWAKYRRTQYLNISKTLKPGLSDEDSFAVVYPDLLRQYKTLKLLESIWKKLRAAPPPVDMKAAADQYGLDYIHMPMRVLSSLTGIDHNNDPRIGGDHPWTMRKIPPGTIYDYKTVPPEYFTEGIVDQPGWHGTIFKLVRAEEMRALEADEAIDRAWADFTLDWRWAKVRDEAAGVEKDARRRAVETAKEKKGRPESFFPDTLKEAVAAAETAGAHGKWVRGVRQRPYRDDKPNPVFEGPVGRRALNFLMREWSRWGGPAATFAANRGLAPAASPDRHVAVFPFVREVIPATAELYAKDIVGKKIAKKSVLDEKEAARLEKVRVYFAWPQSIKNFKLAAADLNRVMQADLEASWPGSRPAPPK